MILLSCCLLFDSDYSYSKGSDIAYSVLMHDVVMPRWCRKLSNSLAGGR